MARAHSLRLKPAPTLHLARFSRERACPRTCSGGHGALATRGRVVPRVPPSPLVRSSPRNRFACRPLLQAGEVNAVNEQAAYCAVAFGCSTFAGIAVSTFGVAASTFGADAVTPCPAGGGGSFI